MELGTKIKVKLEQLLEPSYFSNLIRIALNIDLDRNQNIGLGVWFYIQILWLLVLDIITVWTVIAAWITWDNVDIDPVHVGNYFIGFGIPKEVFLGVFIAASINGYIRYFICYLLYVDDPHLGHVLKLIRTILEQDSTSIRGMDPFVPSKVRKEMRYFVGFTRIFLRTFKLFEYLDFYSRSPVFILFPRITSRKCPGNYP